jgi:hypothetical protein
MPNALLYSGDIVVGKTQSRNESSLLGGGVSAMHLVHITYGMWAGLLNTFNPSYSWGRSTVH